MNGAELRLKRITLGITPNTLANRIGVKHDTLMKWETDRIPIPKDVANTVNNMWENIIDKADIIRDYLEETAAAQGTQPDTVTLHVYLSSEAHKAAKTGMSWEEHTAMVGILAAILDYEGYMVTVEYRK